VLDLKEIRRDPEAVRAALERRGGDTAATVDRVLALDERWRAETHAAEELRAKQKEASQEIGAAKQRGEDAAEAMAAVKAISDDVKARTAVTWRHMIELRENGRRDDG
jgi:seryl-tRNA synthetase